jgi:ribosomal-protein-alanine N-acetyltransferase
VAFHLRQFEKADFDTLWQIDQVCFDPQLAYSRPELAFYMRRPSSFTLVAEDEAGGDIVGFIVAENRRKTGHVITIDVVAAARRSGVGSVLLSAAEDRLKKAGVAVVALETPVNNEAAIRFYKKKGYFVEKTVAGYYSGQLDALVMTKELTAVEASTVETERRS